MNESGVGTIPLILCRPQAKELAIIVSIGRVHSKQQGTLNNESISIYGELQKGSKNGGDIRKRGKVEKAMEFIERMKRVQEEVGAALKKMQEEMKRYADRNRRETENWKKEDRVMLSTKDLVFKERPVQKLVERYVGPYEIEEVVLTNVVKLRLLSSIRIYLVVNVSRIV